MSEQPVLFDSSVLIEWFRGREVGDAHGLVVRGLARITEPVRMEILMGVPALRGLKIMRQLQGFPLVAFDPDTDFDVAAEIYRAVRRAGHTIRSSNDLLIAAVAWRTGIPLLHADKDFDRIAAVLPDFRVWRG